MNRMSLAALAVAASTLGACASMVPPSAQDMASVPVIRYGEDAPAGKEYILLYPAGARLPVVASVGGSLLTKPAQATLEVATNRDVYVYRQWVSFDGRAWKAADDAIDAEFVIEVPGEKDSRSAGAMSARFDIKP